VPVHRRFATVVRGRVYKSGAMSDGGLRRAVLRYRLRSIIDLRRPTPEVEHESEVARALGVAWRNVPASQRPKPPVVDAFLQAVRESEPPLLIHCMHGAGRARLFAAIYRIEFEGWTVERAARSLPWRMRRKRKWMRGYVPRRGHVPVGEAPGVQRLPAT
jgi:hypothetical protein